MTAISTLMAKEDCYDLRIFLFSFSCFDPNKVYAVISFLVLFLQNQIFKFLKAFWSQMGHLLSSQIPLWKVCLPWRVEIIYNKISEGYDWTDDEHFLRKALLNSWPNRKVGGLSNVWEAGGTIGLISDYHRWPSASEPDWIMLHYSWKLSS